MPSNINPSSINTNFPIAGINQSSQGFRTNYSNIQQQLVTASLEITNLQASLSGVVANVGTLTPVLSVNSFTGNVTLNVENLNNVTLSGVTLNQALIWNGSNWTNSSVFASVAFSGSYTDLINLPTISSSISSLSDVSVGSLSSSQLLVYNGTQWTNQSIFYSIASGSYSNASITIGSNGLISAISSGSFDGYLLLDNIENVYTADVTITATPVGVFYTISPTLTAQFKSIVGDGRSINVNSSSDNNSIILSAIDSGISNSLESLTDVSISVSGISNGDVVSYYSGLWINSPISSLTVTSFNTRTGAIILTSLDVTAALGYNPLNPNAGGTIWGGLVVNNPLYAPSGVVGNVSSATRLQIPLTLIYDNDVSGSGSFSGSEGIVSIAITLGSTGVTAGSYTAVTVNSKGLITSGGSLTSLDVTNALGATLGVANGIATLNGAGVVPYSQLPPGLVGAVEYQGTWNAATNSPSLNPTLAGAAGNYWIVATSGTTSMTGVNGAINSWTAGDIIIANGSLWGKIDGNPTEVLNVNGLTGAVSLTVSNIPGAAPLASPSLTGTPTAPTATSGTNTDQIATTSFVGTAINDAFTSADLSQYETITDAALKAPIANPVFTGQPMCPTPGAFGNNVATSGWVQTMLASYATNSALGGYGTTAWIEEYFLQIGNIGTYLAPYLTSSGQGFAWSAETGYGPNNTNGAGGYAGIFTFPDSMGGLILQWGYYGYSGNTGNAYYYNTTFPNNAFVVVGSIGVLNSGLSLGFQTSGNPAYFLVGNNADTIGYNDYFGWIAIGN